MTSQIVWELIGTSIKKISRNTNKLYANGTASAEYGLVSDSILQSDVVTIIASRNGHKYSQRMKYGTIFMEDGTTRQGWKVISNGDELRFDLENGTQEILFNFDIKRYSTIDATSLLADYTTETDSAIVYPANKYYPEVEATDAEQILKDLNDIEVRVETSELFSKGFYKWFKIIVGESEPTTSTVGSVGQYYNYNNVYYKCTSANDDVYTWEIIQEPILYKKNVIVYDEETQNFYISLIDANIHDVAEGEYWKQLDILSPSVTKLNKTKVDKQQGAYFIDIDNVNGIGLEYNPVRAAEIVGGAYANIKIKNGIVQIVAGASRAGSRTIELTNSHAKLIKTYGGILDDIDKSFNDEDIAVMEDVVRKLELDYDEGEDLLILKLLNHNGEVIDEKTVCIRDNSLRELVVDIIDGSVEAGYAAMARDYDHRYGDIKDKFDEIDGVIPSQANKSNQLADKDFVNSSLNSIAAFYITKDAEGNAFETKEELTKATIFYSGGEVRIPTRNDYCLVRADEDNDYSTTRYIYQNGWEFQYIVNETALTAAQLATLNSGLVASDKTQIKRNKTDIADLQSNLNLNYDTSVRVDAKIQDAILDSWEASY